MSSNNNDSIEEHLDILKSFQGYLNNIITSVERNRCYSKTVAKLSSLITEHYEEINDIDSDVEIIDDEIVSITACGSVSSDSDEENFLTPKIVEKEEEPQDLNLENFRNNFVDNTKISLYQKDNIYQNMLRDFILNETSY